MVQPRSNGYVLGIVVKLEDSSPENKNRIQVRIPAIHGPMKESDIPPEWSKSNSWVDDEHLPWVPVCWPLGTRTPEKSIFEEKEIVYIAYTGSGSSSPLVVGTAARKVEEG